MGLQARASGEPDMTSAEAAVRHEAKVMWYDHLKGYGFLMVPGEPDVFVHASEVRRAGIDPNAMKNGFEVTCTIGEMKGRRCALDLAPPSQKA